MSQTAQRHVVINSFADHVDAIPFYMGYAPSGMVILTVLRSSGELEHRISPVGPVLSGGSLVDFVDFDFSDVSLAIVVVLDPSQRIGRATLKWTVEALQEKVASHSATGDGTPQVSAGWASATHYAEMHRNGVLGPLKSRTVSDAAIESLMAGEPVPPGSHEQFLRLFDHSGDVYYFDRLVNDIDVADSAARLEQSFTFGADALNPSRDQVALLAAASGSISCRNALMSRISRANAGCWRAIWHEAAIHSAVDDQASAYTLAAYAAWRDQHGVFALGYLDTAQKIDPNFPLATILADAIAAGVRPDQWVLNLGPTAAAAE